MKTGKVSFRVYYIKLNIQKQFSKLYNFNIGFIERNGKLINGKGIEIAFDSQSRKAT